MSSRSHLRSKGLRATKTRMAVLEALHTHPHSNATYLAERVRDELGSVSKQAIYDILADLTECGVLRRIESAGSAPLYEQMPEDNHHHFICRKCHKVYDVPCLVGERPCLHGSETENFAIDTAEITFRGFCPDCKTESINN